MNGKDKKRLRLVIAPLIFSFLFLVYGTYAWFTYYSDVDSTMTGHVIGWNIDFNGDSDISDEYNIEIEKIYPGMEDFASELSIKNSGEATAKIDYTIKSIKVLGTTYKVGDIVDGITLTSDSLTTFIEEKYPFKFSFEIVNPIIANGEEATFKVQLVWPFETYKKVLDTDVFNYLTEYYVLENSFYVLKTDVNSNNFDDLKSTLYVTNDIEDTYWGEQSYTYINDNPDSSCVELLVEINAVQYIEESGN